MMRLHSRHWRKAGPGASRAGAVCLFGGALIAALAFGAPARAAEKGVTVSQPWMRTIMPSRPAAGYFTLSNETGKARSLVGAESPACGMLMLHKSVSENGVDRMVMEKQIAIPAHGAVRFAPGGYHLMCMAPTAAVKSGNSVPVTLKFGDGGTLMVSFPVRGIADK
jgi:periplasmic copper chaperone A